MEKTFVEKFVEKTENMRQFQQERAIVEVTELLEDALHDRNITRSQFAEMLGKTKGWVSQLLDGEGNKTVRTVADAFAVLGLQFRAYFEPISISNKKSRSASLNGKSKARVPSSFHPNILSIFDRSSMNRESAPEVLQVFEESA
jgi:transcriptional regulator with XRE-family HTH domain